MDNRELVESNAHISTADVERDILDTLGEIDALDAMRPGVEVLNDKVLRLRVESGINRRREFVAQLKRLLVARNEVANSS